MAFTVCGACDQCYPEGNMKCTHCHKTLDEQIIYLEGKKEGYKKGIDKMTDISKSLINKIFFWR